MLKMYNHEYYDILKNNKGLTIHEIIDLTGQLHTTSARSNTARKMRSLVRYGIVRVEKIPNPRNVYFDINVYYLVE